MTPDEIKDCLKAVSFRDWIFHVGDLPGGAIYLQVRFLAPDNDRPDAPPEIQHRRKWLLSEHMTKSELVQTALAAVKMAMEHEIREQFLYAGRPVFSPHFDVAALSGLVDRGQFDLRPAIAPPPLPPLSPPPAAIEIKPPPAKLTRSLLTPQLVRSSRNSETCPACGGRKYAGNHLCVFCWDALPFPNQTALSSSHIGHGREDALFDALMFLGAASLHLPAEAVS